MPAHPGNGSAQRHDQGHAADVQGAAAVSEARDITRATLIAAVVLLGLSMPCGCAPRAPVPMVASPGATTPRWCAQAIRGSGELVVLCSDSWQTCEEARRAAKRWGWWRKVFAVTDACFRSDRKVIETRVHEQRGVVR